MGYGLAWDTPLLWLFAEPPQQFFFLLSTCGKTLQPFSEAFAFPKEIQLDLMYLQPAQCNLCMFPVRIILAFLFQLLLKWQQNKRHIKLFLMCIGFQSQSGQWKLFWLILTLKQDMWVQLSTARCRVWPAVRPSRKCKSCPTSLTSIYLTQKILLFDPYEKGKKAPKDLKSVKVYSV